MAAAKVTVERCPDDGRCHHDCPAAECFRVRSCGPLSGVYPGNEWPFDVVVEWGSAPMNPTMDDLLFGAIEPKKDGEQ